MRRIAVATAMLMLSVVAPVAGQKLPPTAYSGAPIRGVVLDAETGMRLEGVIVAAQWRLYVATVGGRITHGNLHIAETATAADGTYSFAGWGPKPNPLEVNIAAGYICCILNGYAPELTLFKPGYRPFFAENMYESEESVRSSEWDGRTIRLDRPAVSGAERARRLEVLQTALDWNRQRFVNWRQVPRMTLAILEERKGLPRELQHRIAGAEELGASGATEEEVRRFAEGQ